jgi:phytoene dehydrogenase-like protein
VVPNLSSETDWPAITEQYRDAIATVLQESVLPDLKQHVVSSKVTTPQDFQDRLWSYKGAGFGLSLSWFKVHGSGRTTEAKMWKVYSWWVPAASPVQVCPVS